MRPADNMITDRERVRVNQWWTSEALCETRASCYSLINDCVDLLEEHWRMPEVSRSTLRNTRSRQMLANGFMPVKNETFREIRNQYPWDHNDGEVPDDYSDDERRAKLLVPDWFALMVNTWTMDAGLSLASTRHFPIADIHSERKSVENYEWDRKRNAESGRFYTKPFYSVPEPMTLYEKDADEYFDKFNKIKYTGWAQQESLQEARSAYVGGMTSIIEDALNALPRGEEQEVRANMRSVMEKMEPIWSQRSVWLHDSGPSNYHEAIMMVQKEWWSEIHDLYVHGVTPPERFTFKQRAADVIAICIKEKNPGLKKITSMHIESWKHRHPYNARWVYILKGDEKQVRLARVQTVGPQIYHSLQTERVHPRWVQQEADKGVFVIDHGPGGSKWVKRYS